MAHRILTHKLHARQTLASMNPSMMDGERFCNLSPAAPPIKGKPIKHAGQISTQISHMF